MLPEIFEEPTNEQEEEEDPFEVALTIAELRKMQKRKKFDLYWIEETICSLVGMQRKIKRIEKELQVIANCEENG